MKKYVKEMSTLQHNIINLYGLIREQCSSALQSKLEADPEYIINSPTYNFLWLFTKFKVFTSFIDHASNGYYYAAIAIRTIFCLIQVRDESIEAYYGVFEAAISTADLEKCNATTHIELNIVYANVDNE